ncbi:hypothetical protein Glove_340g39 [Diversispora epigaea]|uniref:RING-type domain-containing protein n=1 Tax=Diversispora epigaea TaxID=1348612 RepID=A0A397HHJ8_9GLOM|nr:hypothetical protein Glove_340g39 [Diversispora epigaea]
MSKFVRFGNNPFPSNHRSRSRASHMKTTDEQIVPQSSQSSIESSLGRLIINHPEQRNFQENSENFPNNLFTTRPLVINRLINNNNNHNDNNANNDLSSTIIINNTAMNSVVEDNQSDNDNENLDLEDSLSSDNDDDAPFEYMYNRRIPIINTTHVVNSRSGMRHNTRRHSLRRQSRYITTDQFNWESISREINHQKSQAISTISSFTTAINQTSPSSSSSVSYSSAYSNLLNDSSQSFPSESLTTMSNNNSAQSSSSSHTRSVLHSLHDHYSPSPSPSPTPKSLSPLEIFIKSQLSKQGDKDDGNYDDNHNNRNDQAECFICLESLELRGGRMILNPGCGHLMHMKCYLEYIRKCKNSCAICARKFPTWQI